jgi:hypothetical protein
VPRPISPAPTRAERAPLALPEPPRPAARCARPAIGPDIVNLVDQPQHADAPRARLSAAIALGLTSIAASTVLLTADGIGGSVHWTHHAGASAAPLLLVAGAIAAVSAAHPPKGRHGFMRLVAVLAFTAWGTAQLVPDSAAAGALNDLAILLFVLDAGCAVVWDARTLRQPRRTPPARAAEKTPGMQDTSNTVRPGFESATISPDAKPCCMRTRELCGCAATPGT